jgi:hypothetical protein
VGGNIEALATLGFFAGFSSSPSSALAALVRFGAALPLALGTSSSTSSAFSASSFLTFEVRGVFFRGLISSSDRADDSLPGYSALIVDRDAAARFGLAGDDMMI